ncbi:MAG: hypothetical protein WD738_10370 [Pirellulales bacterium]
MKGLRIWAAPVVVKNPQLALMAKTLAAGTLSAASLPRTPFTDTPAPDWSSSFY